MLGLARGPIFPQARTVIANRHALRIKPMNGETQQYPICTQWAIGGILQLHSTQYFSDAILSPTCNESDPNLQVIFE